MDERSLQRKLELLKEYRNLPPAEVDRFGTLLAGLEDWELLRINPFRFAEQHGLSEELSLELFLHAARIGLFDMAYHMLCPVCGGVTCSAHQLDELAEDSFHCALCNIDVPAHLDEQIEVAFTIHPDVHRLALDPHLDPLSHHRWFFSDNYQRPAEWVNFVQPLTRCFAVLGPDEELTVPLEHRDGEGIQLTSIGRHASCRIRLGQAGEPELPRPTIDLLAEGIFPREIVTSSTRADLTVHNRSRWKSDLVLQQIPLEQFFALEARYPAKVSPFLTAGRLINTTSFRELFRVQRLSPTLRLNLRSLTLLFTDLKGSTAMYEEAGDFFAYELIQEHFQLLSREVRQAGGALVKTMGDAIMASFVSPKQGFRCAQAMIRAIDELNQAWKSHGYPVGLKVGLHCGPALTVINDERLDYFGQTVNIAARIQGLAQAREICVSEALFNQAGLEESELAPTWGATRSEATLKGVAVAVPIVRISCS